MKKSFWLFFIIVIFSAFQSESETKAKSTIWGRLVDHKFNPVNSFHIRVIEKKSSELLQKINCNDDNGEFFIMGLNSGTYIIEVIVPEYTRYSVIKEVSSKRESVGEIFLQNTWD